MPCSNSVGDYENKWALGQNIKIWLAKIRQVSVYSDFQVGWQIFRFSEYFQLPAQRPTTFDFSTQPVHPLHWHVAIFSDLLAQPGLSNSDSLTLFDAEEISPVCSSSPSFWSSLLNQRQSFLAWLFLANSFFSICANVWTASKLFCKCLPPSLPDCFPTNSFSVQFPFH